MLIIQDQEAIDRVKKFATENGSLASLNEQLAYLSTWGSKVEVGAAFMDREALGITMYAKQMGDTPYMQGGVNYSSHSGTWSVNT